jgi:DNA-binding transcriptional LysR family regulator
MDWRGVGFDWNRVRAFLVTAEEGSYSAAARALGQSQPTIGRQVAALEAELGVALFERVGHGLELTEAGLELVDHARAMGEAALHLSRRADGQATSLEGTVRITASEVMSAFVLPRLVAELRRLHPGIRLDVVASIHPSDLRRREADLAIRHFRPTDGELIARFIGEQAAPLYATPEYLARIGDPRTPEALSERAELIFFERSERVEQVLAGLGLHIPPERLILTCENQLVQWAMTRAGLGLGVIMESVGDAEPSVVRVLPEQIEPMRFPTWLSCHRELRTNRRLRVVFDLLAELLSAL